MKWLLLKELGNPLLLQQIRNNQNHIRYNDVPVHEDAYLIWYHSGSHCGERIRATLPPQKEIKRQGEKKQKNIF
jgi:hypothetical protein